MARQTGWVFAALLAWTTPASADELRCVQGAQQKPTSASAASASKDQPSNHGPWKWWLHNRADLGISDQQSTQIDQIWESTVPTLREMRKNLEALEEALSKTVKAYSVDVTTLGREIDKVERARAEYSKTRALMLYKIDLVLTPDQRTKVRALREKRDAERRKDDRRH